MTEYQLRHIGKPATVFGVKDILKLTKEVTKFGRHSQNDHFLDSADYMCLISRWHAEIHRQNEGGKLKFVLRDNGLNGTFVNDVRVDGSIVIEVGDVITFGHPNGKKIKPGERSEQTDSEFSFLFEKLCDDMTEESLPGIDHLKSEIKREYMTINNNSRKPGTHKVLIHDLKRESGLVEHALPQQVLPKVAETAVLPVEQLSEADVPVVHTGRLGSSSLTTKLGTEHAGHSTFILKDISNNNSSQGLVHLDELLAKHNSVSQPAQVGLSVNNSTAQNSTVGLSHMRDSSGEESDGDIFQASVHTGTQDYLTTQEASTSQNLPVTISQLQMHLQKSNIPSPYTPLSSVLDKPSQLTTNSIGLTKSQKVKGRRSSSGRKRSFSVRSEDFAEADTGPKKRRRKSTAKNNRTDTSLNFTVDHSNEEELPTFHYDGDRCDSYDCCQPLSTTVSWVQCDDCDKWYHTACAGTNYDDVKRTNAEFRCGC